MTDTLYAALLAAQSEAPGLQKTAINPHFKNRYVSLESLMDQILPILNNHGLVLMQAPTTLDGAPALKTTIVHAKTGEHVEDTMLLEATKRDPQGQGSAITYARRYSLMALLGLVADVDDDGAAASRPRRKASGGEPKAAAPVSAPARGGEAPSPPKNGKGVITRDQVIRLWAIVHEGAVTEDAVREILIEVAGVESSAEIPVGKYDAVIGAIEASSFPF